MCQQKGKRGILCKQRQPHQGEGQKSERFNKGEDLLEVTHRPLALLDLLLCLWKIDTPQAGLDTVWRLHQWTWVLHRLTRLLVLGHSTHLRCQ
ncbi:hypothetical protein WJX75_001573 [Coccomyxa subellipsoidea]|uniref:Uncharacterized protein n=1 Tax=Coccomyxa subellipsoidea TaxID=248742 RepID=A0ABR2YER5_9CHLO